MDIRNMSFEERCEIKRKARKYDALKSDIFFLSTWLSAGLFAGLLYYFGLDWHWLAATAFGVGVTLFFAFMQIFVLEDTRLVDNRGGEFE